MLGLAWKVWSPPKNAENPGFADILPKCASNVAIFGEKISLFLGFWPLCLRWPLLGLAWKVLSLPQNVLKTLVFCECGLWLLVFWPPALVQVGFAASVFANVGCGSVFLSVVFSFTFVLVCFLSFSPPFSASLFLFFSFSVFFL